MKEGIIDINIKKHITVLSGFKLPFAQCFLLAVVLFFGVVIPTLNLGLVEWIISQLSDELMIVTTALVFIILIVLWNPTRKYWSKYRNSYNLKQPPFLLTDYLFLTSLIIVVLWMVSGLRFPIIPHQYMEYLYTQAVSILIWFLLTYVLSPIEEQQTLPDMSNFPSDAPIILPEQDLLGRAEFVDNLYKEIIGLPFSDSFVFGLFGKWGEGKTSTLNLLNLKLLANEDFISLNFQPWRFKNEDVIFNALYSQIEEVVGEKYLFPDFLRELRKYKRKISVGFSNMGMNMGLEFGLEKDSIDQMRINIERGICQLGKKIVIVIDDIDRLQPKEMLLIFQAVKSHMMFKNLIFILSMDNERVSQKIEKHGGEDYLSKIIQKPIPLPPPEPDAYSKSLFFSDHQIPRDQLDKLAFHREGKVSIEGYVQESSLRGLLITKDKEGFKNKTEVLTPDRHKNVFSKGERVFVVGQMNKGKLLVDSPETFVTKFRLSLMDTLFYLLLVKDKISSEEIEIFDKEMIHFYRTHLSKKIRTLRDVKRFINSLQSSLPPIVEEINLKDFVLLEFLKVFYPKIYNDIYGNWWFYVKERFEEDYINNPLAFSLSTDKQKDQQQSKEHIEATLKSVTDERDRMICRAILLDLFPRINDYAYENPDRKSKAISTQSFIKYFTLKIPQTELSDTFIKSLIGRWQKNMNIKEIINDFSEIQKAGKLKELIIKLNRDYSSEFSEEFALLIMRAIYENAKTFSRAGTNDFWNSEYDKAVALTFRLLDSNVSRANIHKIAEEIISKTSDMAFAAHAVLFCTQERGGSLFNVYDSVQLDKLRELASNKFKKHYIDESRNIFTDLKITKEWVFVLFQWGSNFSTFAGQNSSFVNNYVLKHLRNDPKKFYEYINLWRSGGFKDDWKMNLDEFRKIYNVQKFAALAKKFLGSPMLNSEEKNILKMFIDSASIPEIKS